MHFNKYTDTPTHKHSCVVPPCPQLCTCYECTQKRMRTHRDSSFQQSSWISSWGNYNRAALRDYYVQFNDYKQYTAQQERSSCVVHASIIDKERRVFKFRRRIRGTKHSMLWRIRQAGVWSTAQGGMPSAVFPFPLYVKGTGTGDVSFLYQHTDKMKDRETVIRQ